MRRRRQRKPTLLGEAFAMKESTGWEDVADNMHIQEKIAADRRRLMLRLTVGVMGLVIVSIVLYRLF